MNGNGKIHWDGGSKSLSQKVILEDNYNIKLRILISDSI
jgi:hypothetical protein